MALAQKHTTIMEGECENWVNCPCQARILVTPPPAEDAPQGSDCGAASNLGGALVPPYRFGQGGPGGWIILGEVEVRLEDDLFAPDISGWRKDRTGLPFPDWICEILSPGSIRHDRITKARSYARHGIPYLWLIDPRDRLLQVFKLEAGRWLSLGDFAEDDKVRAEPFSEIDIDLANLWLEDRLPGVLMACQGLCCAGRGEGTAASHCPGPPQRPRVGMSPTGPLGSVTGPAG
ncbi:MAG: Uma2 family endonuclease [Thermodesulfobacteriota bacterium]